MQQTTIQVAGMSCGHCVAAVTEELRKLAGVNDVTVDLGGEEVSTVLITSTDALSHDDLAHAVDEAGYRLVG